MKQYLKCLIIVGVVVSLISMVSNHKPTQAVTKAPPPKHVQAAAVIKPVAVKPAPPIPKPAPAPVKFKPWSVDVAVGGVAPSRISYAVAYYQTMGMSRQGASYLVGNFIQENHLETDTCGQDGDTIACGLAQWHPGRRGDMPTGTAQFKWAVNVEMARHSPELRAALFDPNASTYAIISGIKHWEGYGVEGSRFYFGQVIFNNLK